MRLNVLTICIFFSATLVSVLDDEASGAPGQSVIPSIPVVRRPGQSKLPTGMDCLLNPVCNIAFVMGHLSHEGASAAERESQEAALRLEQEKFKDVLKEDFVDSYSNLTLKSLFSLKYFNNSPKRDDKDLGWVVKRLCGRNIQRKNGFVQFFFKYCFPAYTA